MKRKASITRKTKETKIDVELNIDGKGQYKIEAYPGQKPSEVLLDLISKYE